MQICSVERKVYLVEIGAAQHWLLLGNSRRLRRLLIGSNAEPQQLKLSRALAALASTTTTTMAVPIVEEAKLISEALSTVKIQVQQMKRHLVRMPAAFISFPSILGEL